MDTRSRIVLSLFIICIGVNEAAESNKGTIYRLARDLLKDYESDMLPNCTDDRPPVKVFIGLSLNNILDVDERGQILKTSMWVRWSWNDCRLQWDPAKYDDVTVIHVSREKVWIPDITLYDSASVMDIFDVIQYQRPVISYTGHVVFGFPSIMSSTCHMDIINFPYDFQRCRLKFSSWSYDGRFLDVTNHSATGDLSSYTVNNEWSLEGFDVNRSVVTYATSLFPDVTYYIEIRRHPLHYYLNLLLPCVLINLIGVFMFLLPPESGERIGLGITALLAMVVFSMNMASALPATSFAVPHITKYFSCAIVLVACSTICTICIMRVRHIGGSIHLPRWVKRAIIDCLGSIVLLGNCCQYQKLEDEADSSESEAAKNESDWKALVVVIARILFLVAGVVFVIITLGIAGVNTIDS